MPSAPDRFQTDRMTATRLTAADEGVILSIDGDPVAMASIGGVRDPAKSAIYMRLNLAHWADKGFGMYLLHGREDGVLLGRAGIRTIHIGGVADVELSYVMVPAAWGRGLATEIGRALVGIARDGLGLPGLVAIIDAANGPSLRVAAKCGFVPDGTIERSSGLHELHRLVF